jgi:hypothetical protein
MLYNPDWKPKTEPIVDAVGMVMLKAADYLETNKWGQGDFLLSDGAVCLMGALQKIETGTVVSYLDDELFCPIADKALDRIEKYLNKHLPPNIHKFSDEYVLPYDFNDEEDRTKEEVIDVLRKASTFI